MDSWSYGRSVFMSNETLLPCDTFAKNRRFEQRLSNNDDVLISDMAGNSNGFSAVSITKVVPEEEDEENISSSSKFSSQELNRIDFKLRSFLDLGNDDDDTSSRGFALPSKKSRASNLCSQNPLCQVYGCSKDLSSSKDYHKRHRVCEAHSKTSVVIVNGLEQRFCQQCSRFHQLPEFDLEKRSCRRRLAGHNERRRKPQPASLSVLASRYGRIAPSLYENGDAGMNGSFLGNQEIGWPSSRTLDTRVMRRPVSSPSWQINPMNVFSQGSVGGGGTSFSSPEIMDTKLESYKGIGDSNCALSLLSNPHQPHDNNNNNNNNNNKPHLKIR